MKKAIFLSFFFIIIALPNISLAAFGNLPAMVKMAKSLYSVSFSELNKIKEEARGSYLPGVFDSSTPRFSFLKDEAKEKIVQQNEEARLKRVARAYTLGSSEPLFEGKYIDVDLSTQTLTAFDNKEAVYKFKISSGKWSMPTPIGTYSILNKIPRAYSRKYNLYMPYWMAFRWDGYGFHELPEWSNGAKEGESHLGTPVSHGCVRMGVGSAEAVYDWTNVGDKVYIHK
jgi:hypothetical protein